ncbi:MAG: DUF2277 domain-containing protein [Chloroflexi bacterium]|nr:DUF2277 domain-containing protein [Chloroflexota bacterium]
MCRNIKTLFNYYPPTNDEEIYDSSLQYVRKITGFGKPSKLNEAAFETAVNEISIITKQLIDSLETGSPPRNRATEIARAKAKAQERFGPAS